MIILIVLDAGMGHQAVYVLQATELAKKTVMRQPNQVTQALALFYGGYCENRRQGCRKASSNHRSDKEKVPTQLVRLDMRDPWRYRLYSKLDRDNYVCQIQKAIAETGAV